MLDKLKDLMYNISVRYKTFTKERKCKAKNFTTTERMQSATTRRGADAPSDRKGVFFYENQSSRRCTFPSEGQV